MTTETIKTPLVGTVCAGFPSPADDYLEQELDLNEHFVHRPAATYFMRVKGDAMTGAGIFDGDTLIVDRSLAPITGKVVVAELDGELTVRRIEKNYNGIVLRPENPRYSPVKVQELTIWGVVTSVVHSL